jgi:hypothetical protein
MRCLRRATLLISLKDKQRNENIRKRLGIEPVVEFIKRQQIKWFGHLQRIPPIFLPYRTYNELANGFKAKEYPDKDGEKTLTIPCNNMVKLLMTQQDEQEQESSKHLNTR